MTRPAAVRPWLVLAPVPAIATGLAVARSAGVPWAAYLPNLIGVALGTVLLWLTVRARGAVAAALPVIAAVAIAATLLVPGSDGVHRWLALGPLRLNMSAALAPWLVLGLGAERHRALAIIAVVVAQLAHVVQPDAGQATALAIGVVVAAIRLPPRIGVPLAVATIGLAVAAWLRPDPLLPVDHVERILVLASARGAIGLAAVAAAGIVLALPLATRATLAPLLYLVAAFAVTFVGNFPVPVFGAGAGPVIGWYTLAAHIGGRRGRADVAADRTC